MNSSDGPTIYLSLDDLARLQSLLEVLDCSLSDPSSPASIRDSAEDIITLDDGPGDDNENTIHDELEFHSNLEVVGSLVKEELDSGDESFQSKHKDNRMVSILRNNQKPNSRAIVASTSNPSHVRSIFSSPEGPSQANIREDVGHNITKFMPRPFTAERTGGITQLESKEDEIEKPNKYVAIPLSRHKEKIPKSIPLSRKTEKFIVSKKTSVGPAVKSRSQIGLTTWETKKPGEGRTKPMPLSKKDDKLPRSRSESQSDETEDISSLMKFFGPSAKPTPASTKGDKSKPKTDRKRVRRCGKCTNCEINKQVKR